MTSVCGNNDLIQWCLYRGGQEAQDSAAISRTPQVSYLHLTLITKNLNSLYTIYSIMSDQTTMAMCSCNSIKLSLHGDPQESMACYCVDCQKAAGGPCTTDVVFPQDKVDIMDPEHVAKEWSQKGITGGNKTKVFCGNCGCTMIVKSEAFNDQIIVRTGVIEGG